MPKGLNMQHLTEFIKNSKGFEQVLQKLKIISAGQGKCLAELKIEQEHTNSMGSLHGGLSATLVDSVSTYALLTDDKGAVPNVSVDMHMTYIKGAKLGDEILIDASTIKAGKTLAFLEVEIKNKATGDLLVKGSHTKFLMQPKT